MRFHDSDEYRHRQQIDVLHSGPRLSRSQGRAIFRQMVRMETRDGQLSPRRRKRLIQYAAALQLTPIEAGRIVSEVHLELGVSVDRNATDSPMLYRVVETAADPKRWPVWLKMTLVLIVMLATDRLIRWSL